MTRNYIFNQIDLENVIKEEGKKVVIYGCRSGGRLLQQELLRLRVDEYCFAVSDEEHREKNIVGGIPVYTLDEIPFVKGTYICFITVTSDLRNQMSIECKKRGISYYQIMQCYLDELSEDWRVNSRLFTIEKDLSQIKKKLSMKDDIWQNADVKFYVPHYPLDMIANRIVDQKKFFEERTLKELDLYIPRDAVILDLGSNVGNHSLYWAIRSGAKRIYAFEPVKETYEVMQKNIEINHLEDIVIPYMCGVSDVTENADFSVYEPENIANASMKSSESGEMKMIRIDDLVFTEDRIDFVKIDVEGYEVKALKGMRQTLKKYKPHLFIESFSNNYTQVKQILEEIGYIQKKAMGNSNYLFVFEK